MRLFGKRNKEKDREKDSVLLAEPVGPRLPEEGELHPVAASAMPADAVMRVADEPVRSHEELIRENMELREQVAGLKARIERALAALSGEELLPGEHLSPAGAPIAGQEGLATAGPGANVMTSMQAAPAVQPHAQPAAAVSAETPHQLHQAHQGMTSAPSAPLMPGMEGAGPMAGISAAMPQPPAPGEDIRAMLAELKQDIAAMRSGAAGLAAMGVAASGMSPLAAGGSPVTGAMPQAQPEAAAPMEDVRAMLAELKRDIAAIQRDMPQPAPAMPQPSAPGEDIRAMLAELKQDIAAIRSEAVQQVRPVMATPAVAPAEDLRAMLAELKQDIAAIRSEDDPARNRRDDDLREMLARLKADIDSLKNERREAEAFSAAPESAATGEAASPPSSPAMPENGVHRLLEELQQGVAELSAGTTRQEEPAARVEEGTDTPAGPAASAEAGIAEESLPPLKPGHKPLFGGGAVAKDKAAPKTAPATDGQGEKAASTATAGEEDDSLSSRIESLLAELHNELRQASGREFLKEDVSSPAAKEGHADETSGEEGLRRVALH
jgi:hypothetical protein